MLDSQLVVDQYSKEVNSSRNHRNEEDQKRGESTRPTDSLAHTYILSTEHSAPDCGDEGRLFNVPRHARRPGRTPATCKDTGNRSAFGTYVRLQVPNQDACLFEKSVVPSSAASNK